MRLGVKRWAHLLRLRQRTPPVTPLASSTVVRCCVHPKLCLEVNLALALRLQSRGGVLKPSTSGPGGDESSRPESCEESPASLTWPGLSSDILLPRVSSILGLLLTSPLLGSPTIPKGFILLTELEVVVKLCLEMFEKLGLPMDLVLLILNMVAGLVHAS